MALTPEATSCEGSDPAIVEVALAGRTYEVTIEQADQARLAPKQSPEQLAEAAFRFLLDREPPDAIMPSFGLMTIARYFPEFEETLPDYL